MLTLAQHFLASVLLCSLSSVFSEEIVSTDNVPIQFNHDIINTEGLTPHAIYNNCGGVVEAKLDGLVVIEYKPNEEYANNEMCVWAVRNNEANNMLITKTQSDFEVGFDYIQVADFSVRPWEGPDSSRQLGNVSGIEQITALRPLAYIIFSSDSSNVGKGFRLEIVGYFRRVTPYLEEDFFTRETNGETVLRPYHHNMFTTFTFAPELMTASSLVLDIEYLTELTYDRATVFQLERNGRKVKFKFLSILEGSGNRTFEAVYYTYFVVMFTSDSSNADGGLTLNWYEPEDSTRQ